MKADKYSKVRIRKYQEGNNHWHLLLWKVWLDFMPLQAIHKYAEYESRKLFGREKNLARAKQKTAAK